VRMGLPRLSCRPRDHRDLQSFPTRRSSDLIGAGALGTVALFLLYPMLPTVRLVVTEIAHDVPLTPVAGPGHAGLGNVDWPLLMNLLIGSLPVVNIGGHLANRVADHFLRPALALMLLLVGVKLVIV